jgi:hypothetical protein
MPLSLDEAFEVLRRLTNKPNYVLHLKDRVKAWFFELTENPNMLYQTVMSYDGEELTVEKAYYVQVEPPAQSDITKTWYEIPLLKAQFKIVKDELDLP